MPTRPRFLPSDRAFLCRSEREHFFVDVGVVDAEFVQGEADGCGHAGRAAEVDVTFLEVAKQAAQRCG
jgi:hypothetical protein